MKIFRISNISPCGTYFAAYLQSVTVVADSKQDAVNKVNKWLLTSDYSFENHNCWQYDELVIDENGVVDFVCDSDY